MGNVIYPTLFTYIQLMITLGTTRGGLGEYILYEGEYTILAF